MPRLNYVNQTAKNVGVDYFDMPVGTQVVFVNTSSGAKTPSHSNALSKGGDRSAEIPIDPKLIAGQYYLLAESQAGMYLAQTVPFHIS
jgi:hypothetical protein